MPKLAHHGRYDGTIRTAAGNVVQFLYGEDGMDGTAIESQKLDSLRMKDSQFAVRLPHTMVLHSGVMPL